MGTVTIGADRLFDEYIGLIKGSRVALLGNHTARLHDGTHVADALADHAGVRLGALFGMHHDVRTCDYSLPRDPFIAMDTPTGVPKYDLYVTNHRPTEAMMRDIDVVVVDVQDVGARFYEHINVLGFVLEAAALAHSKVVVLDRPNPTAPLPLEGFLPDEQRLHTFGSYGPIPMTHGMTVAELAAFYVGSGLLRTARAPELAVVPMTGWSRNRWGDELGRPYQRPSPNLLRMSSVLGYAGSGMFEALNVSEGRGTDHPFEQVGSPWLDPERVLDQLEPLGLQGVTFEPVTFTPVKAPFHGSPPLFAGQALRGIRIHLVERTQYKPVQTAIALWWAIAQTHPHELEVGHRAYEHFLANARWLEMLTDGVDPREICRAWEPDVSSFIERRAPFLIYP